MATRTPTEKALVNDQTLTENSFSRGIVRDSARHAIPQGGVYDSLDYLLDKPGVAYKRGGSEFQSGVLDDASPTDTIVVAVACPEFPNDPRVIAITSNGDDRTLYDVTEDTPTAGILVPGGPASAEPHENMTMYVDKLILCDAIGDGFGGNFYGPQKITLTAGTVGISLLGGSPPHANLSCMHLSYLVLARSEANPNRLWFSPFPNIEDTWDTTNAYIDVPTAITGLASVNGTLLVFTRNDCWRILGNVPPGTEGENMELQPAFGVGCIDARSIVKMSGLVYWACESGVYYTNAAGIESVTSKQDGTGITQMWAGAVDGFSPVLGSVVCAGVWLNKYLFITVRHTDTDPQEGARYQFLYHAPSGSWTRLSDGVTADMYATRNAPEGEIYASCGDAADPVRLLKLSGLFNPTDANSKDANDEDIEPMLELRPFAAGPTLKAYGHAHLTVKTAANAAVDSFMLEAQTAPGMYPTTFTTRRALIDQDGLKRKRFDTNLDEQAVTVRVQQTGPSAVTEILSVEMDVRGYDEPSEVA